MGPANWAVLRFWITTFPHGVLGQRGTSYFAPRAPLIRRKDWIPDPTNVAGGLGPGKQPASKAQSTHDIPHRFTSSMTTSLHFISINPFLSTRRMVSTPEGGEWMGNVGGTKLP